jgi:antitoxin ParD1/3/4
MLHAALRLLEDQEKLREVKPAELRAAIKEGEDSRDAGTAEEALAVAR